MTLLEEVIELDTMLANDGYKDWGYARLTLDKVMKHLRTAQLQQHVVMQAEGSDGEVEAAVGQRSVDKSVCGGHIWKKRNVGFADVYQCEKCGEITP